MLDLYELDVKDSTVLIIKIILNEKYLYKNRLRIEDKIIK